MWCDVFNTNGDWLDYKKFLIAHFVRSSGAYSVCVFYRLVWYPILTDGQGGSYILVLT